MYNRKPAEFNANRPRLPPDCRPLRTDAAQRPEPGAARGTFLSPRIPFSVPCPAIASAAQEGLRAFALQTPKTKARESPARTTAP